MPLPSSLPASVRLVSQALAIYAREIDEDAENTEVVMADFLASMMALAEYKDADFRAIAEAARSQHNGGF